MEDFYICLINASYIICILLYWLNNKPFFRNMFAYMNNFLLVLHLGSLLFASVLRLIKGRHHIWKKLITFICIPRRQFYKKDYGFDIFRAEIVDILYLHIENSNYCK